MADSHGEFHHGGQDASVQAADFRMFAALAKWVSVIFGALILMLTLWFCTGAGFFGGLVPGLIVLGLGAALLRNKPRQIH